MVVSALFFIACICCYYNTTTTDILYPYFTEEPFSYFIANNNNNNNNGDFSGLRLNPLCLCVCFLIMDSSELFTSCLKYYDCWSCGRKRNFSTTTTNANSSGFINNFIRFIFFGRRNINSLYLNPNVTNLQQENSSSNNDLKNHNSNNNNKTLTLLIFVVIFSVFYMSTVPLSLVLF